MTVHRQQPGYWLCFTFLIMFFTATATRLQASPQEVFADKPADPGFIFTRAVFACTPNQIISVSPGLAVSIADTTSGTGIVSGYACLQWSETGPEAFYELDVSAEVDLFVGLRDMGDTDLDLFLLTECDNDSCLIGANIEFNTRLQPGTYTLVVDGYAKPEPQAGPYTLEISAHEPGLPQEVCAGDATIPIICQLATATFEGDLNGLPDLVRTNDCTLITTPSGDQWYAVTVAAYHEFTATISNVPPTLDPVLWLFPQCGPTAWCSALVDEKTVGQGETMTWSNTSYRDSTVYLGVDAILPPENISDGSYTLEIHCQAMVAAEKKSFGSLRAMFR